MKIKIIFVLMLISVALSGDSNIIERTIADSLPKNMPIIKK